MSYPDDYMLTAMKTMQSFILAYSLYFIHSLLHIKVLNWHLWHKMFFTEKVLYGLHTKNNKIVILRTVPWGTKHGSSGIAVKPPFLNHIFVSM